MKDHKLGMEKYNIREYWNKRAEIGKDSYEKVCVYGLPIHCNRILEIMQRDCLNYLLRIEKKRILEVGCGVGRWGKFMIGKGACYTGVDISPKMIEIARKNVPEGEFYVIDGGTRVSR